MNLLFYVGNNSSTQKYNYIFLNLNLIFLSRLDLKKNKLSRIDSNDNKSDQCCQFLYFALLSFYLVNYFIGFYFYLIKLLFYRFWQC